MSIIISTKKFNAKFIAVFLVGMITTFTVGHLEAQVTENRPGIFYAITGKGLKDTSWLFGTFHLVNNSYLSEVPQAMESFNKARGVVVEIVIDSSELQATQQYGISKDKKLTDVLDKPFLDSLETELKNNIGAGVDQFNQLKPMNVTLTLSIIHLIKNNSAQLKKYTGLPLDAYFADAGKKMKKTVTPLETIGEQMELLFNSQSIEQQAEALKTFLRKKNEMVKLGDQLLQSWFSHNMDAMNNIYQQTMELSGEEDYLVKERNLRWMKVLPGLLQKDSQFIAVGALHLAGQFGLVEQLKQSGYTVTPVKL